MTGSNMYSHMNNPMAGQTKNVQNYISATFPDGHTEILFTPLAPFETPEALDRICEEYNKVIGNMELEPLIAIPIFIHDFLCIHPFNEKEVTKGYANISTFQPEVADFFMLFSA
ncbi:Fic family protein [Oscillibacter sp. ER4]|uniref:Fic family protein n=1 Tax=Oscillibacter sp. ER4 TaxID=1519439 RepID=UPI00051B1ECE